MFSLIYYFRLFVRLKFAIKTRAECSFIQIFFFRENDLMEAKVLTKFTDN